MALTKTLWTSIVDLVSTGQNVSDKLDTAFANVDNAMTQVDTNTANIAALQTLDDAISIVTTTPLSPQALVAGIPEKLLWMTTALVDSGTAISHTLASSDILINEASTYEVFGVINIESPINEIVDIEVYIDNLPSGFKSSMIGRGIGNSVSYTYSFLIPFSVNDDVHLYITSTGTTATVNTASVTVKKTLY